MPTRVTERFSRAKAAEAQNEAQLCSCARSCVGGHASWLRPFADCAISCLSVVSSRSLGMVEAYQPGVSEQSIS